MTVASLNAFSDELQSYVTQLIENNQVCFDSLFQQKRDQVVEEFKAVLLTNLRTGKMNLKAGGYGLETLLKELMEIEGYTATIAAKNSQSGIADVDIVANRSDPMCSNQVLIQAKHHTGVTSDWGIKQLREIDRDGENCEHVDKWLITTGTVAEQTKQIAETAGIQVMEGEDLIEWVYTRIEQLSPQTKEQLGVGILPQIIS